MTELSKNANSNNVNRVLAGRCLSCKNWKKEKDYEDWYTDMGTCMFFSGVRLAEDVYPNTNVTGIESYPICEHDGKGFSYSTKSWFGCIHFNAS